MTFQKGHKFFAGSEKGWFRKGQLSPLRGIKLSKEHKEKLRQAKLKNPMRYWLGKHRDEKTREKIRKNRVGKATGVRIVRIPWRCKMCGKVTVLLPCHAKNKKFCSRSCAFKRERNPSWKGGITSEIMKIRNSLEMKKWRESVFKRDNYTCKSCEKKNGMGKTIVLNAHHIKPFAQYPELRLDLSNGCTLCKECHYSKMLETDQ